jgi:hypothetical protein
MMLETERLILADSLAAPGRVLARHRRDELADIGPQTGTTKPDPRLPSPEQRPAAAEPADDRRRLDDHEVAAPVVHEPADEDPEDPIAVM